MGIVIGWIVFSIIVGALGSSRKIGFGAAFFLSLLLSPLIGLIITLFSKDKEDEQYKQDLLNTQKMQQETLSNIQDNVKSTSISEQLMMLKEMKDNGMLTEEEFQKAKEKILA